MATPPRTACIPMRCPKCPPKHFYGRLWVPWEDVPQSQLKCENCGTKLVPSK